MTVAQTAKRRRRQMRLTGKKIVKRPLREAAEKAKKVK